MTSLTDRLKEAMGKDVSQADLARACGISRAAVTKWMSGAVDDLKMAHLFTVSRLCGVNPEWLALGTGRKGPSLAGGGSAAVVAEGSVHYDAEPSIEHRHRALLQAYQSLPEETRFAVRMLIETLAGAQNPRMHAFMRELEQFNHKRDSAKKPRKGKVDEKE